MAHRPQSANRLTETVTHAVRVALRASGARRVLVACSGGADSVCLLDAVAHAQVDEPLGIAVGHVRHGVRAGDDTDAAVARAHAVRLTLPYECVTLAWEDEVGASHRAEATLRTRRYQALAAMARAADADAILTGHTLDDQAETVLLHLLRGAGLDGLRGMGAVAPIQTDAGVLPTPARGSERATPLLLRPLLAVRRAETVAYCRAHELAFVDDPSNADTRYTRNWLRQEVLPWLATRAGDVSATLARTASVLATEADFMEEQTAAALARCLVGPPRDVVTLYAAMFSAEHPALQRRMLRTLIPRVTGRMPTAADVEAVWHAATVMRTSRIVATPTIACLRYDDLLLLGATEAVRADIFRRVSERHPLFRGATGITIGQPFDVPASAAGVACYRFAVESAANHLPMNATRGIPIMLPAHPEMMLRNRQAGDRFHPAGRPHALPLQDYLTERHVPAAVRDWLPLLLVNGTIAYVFGYDVGAGYDATAEAASHRLTIVRHDAHRDGKDNATDGRNREGDSRHGGDANDRPPHGRDAP